MDASEPRYLTESKDRIACLLPVLDFVSRRPAHPRLEHLSVYQALIGFAYRKTAFMYCGGMRGGWCVDFVVIEQIGSFFYSRVRSFEVPGARHRLDCCIVRVSLRNSSVRKLRARGYIISCCIVKCRCGVLCGDFRMFPVTLRRYVMWRLNLLYSVHCCNSKMTHTFARLMHACDHALHSNAQAFLCL